jgi:hypothetical protein
MAKRLMVVVSDVLKDYPLMVVVQETIPERTPQRELNDYFTDRWVKNHFSTPYEQ